MADDEAEPGAPPAEALVLRSAPTPASRNRATESGDSITTGMRVALSAGAIVFHLGALVQVIAVLWAGWALALTLGTGSVLARTRGLDERTYETCVWIAVAIDAVLLLGVAISWFEHAPDDSAARPPHERGFGDRHPVVATTIWLLGASAVTTAASWWPSSYFPTTWTTVVVLTTVGFVAATGAGAVAILLARRLDRLRLWGMASQYRAGLLTGAFVLLGAGGGAALGVGWYEDPVEDIAHSLGADRLDDGGHYPIEDSLQALCIGAEEVDAESVRGAGAPACAFLQPGGGAPGGLTGEGEPDCFTILWNEARRVVMKNLERDFRISSFDANDVAVHAIEKTCTQEPPPLDIIGYFKSVARNRAMTLAGWARRHVSCDRVAASQLPSCELADPPMRRTEKLGALWAKALCELDGTTGEILRRYLVDAEKFPVIAKAMNLTREQVRDRFHNALKKLRKLGIADCFREQL